MHIMRVTLLALAYLLRLKYSKSNQRKTQIPNKKNMPQCPHCTKQLLSRNSFPPPETNIAVHSPKTMAAIYYSISCLHIDFITRLWRRK